MLFVVNIPEFFLSHRLPIAITAKSMGFTVHVATGPGSACQKISELGFAHHLLSISRSGRNLLAELKTFWSLYLLMRSVRPDLVHLVTIKPVLYGGLAARLARVPAMIAAISGLGTVFISEGQRASLVLRVVKLLYRLALGHSNSKVVFQNPSDLLVFSEMGAVRNEQGVLIKGSGVSLGEYRFFPELEGTPVVVFAGRFLEDKGVREFVGAARILKARGVVARFLLIGSIDPDNLTSISEGELLSWSHVGIVEQLGHRDDIADCFSKSNIVVLPSYREGLPKVLIEAAACGRAVVTTDVPGCRDAIIPNETGLLVPPRDAEGLADAIQWLIEHPNERVAMGEAGRQLAEREFEIEKIVNAHLKIYQELLENVT